MTGDVVVLDIADGRAIIALNRPEKLNALSLELVTSLEQVVRGVAAGSRVGIVGVQGRGRSFCAGLLPTPGGSTNKAGPSPL